ncbi:redoxin domain-containing protein [Chryseosolibacter indicus]|uniref:TlpA family protein disulfide reductase n=1 Tax=Chryseosolibacter indicus TaxID=2782351 RepID=A0ABS5VU07_9BACT|nr:redoxin domain-containing protein [Chryseosolibacter indicus]MBT1704908.1 TlpA family protein disulfide reductase [Chryseosolibacter indicus]
MKRKLCFIVLLCLRLASASKLFFIVTLITLSTTCVFSQSPKPPLFTVGDKAPELVVYNILNHPSGKAQLSSYRGKLLILDFMATWCSLCASLLPKTDSLQKEVGSQVQFLPVTYQSKADVEKFLARLKGRGISISLPIAVSDTVLRSLFTHHYIPHYVWIDGEGTIKAITGHEEVTRENIRHLLKTGSLQVKTKNDRSVPYNRDQLLIAENNQVPNKNITYQSAFTGFIEGLPSSFTIFPVEASKPHRIVATNARIPTLFKIAYGALQGKVFNDNTILLEMQDTTCCDSQLSGTRYSEWLSTHGYGYELIVPPSMHGQQAQLMQQDLARMFPQYKATIEKRSFPCLALVRTSKADKIKSTGGASSTEVTPFGAQIHNQKFFQFIYQLNAKYLSHLAKPVIDQTQYTGNVSLAIHADMGNLNAIRKALATYDLDLVPGTQEVEVLVITDRDY